MYPKRFVVIGLLILAALVQKDLRGNELPKTGLDIAMQLANAEDPTAMKLAEQLNSSTAVVVFVRSVDW